MTRKHLMSLIDGLMWTGVSVIGVGAVMLFVITWVELAVIVRDLFGVHPAIGMMISILVHGAALYGIAHWLKKAARGEL